MGAPAENDETRFPRALMHTIGFVQALELDTANGAARVAYEGRPEFTHSNGTVVQGGILTAWLDNAMARAVIARDPAAKIASLEIKVSFIARVGPGPCIAQARVVKWGRTVVFLEAELLSPEGKLLARASSSGLFV